MTQGVHGAPLFAVGRGARRCPGFRSVGKRVRAPPRHSRKSPRMGSRQASGCIRENDGRKNP
ncbi:hypothetical protein WQQ_08250 [Hydrocarboniphaga effusa AP103]|uniref:Uncharacterized protein n=1 Tax=Hydrocarboniphaga effusa AP103 TaxID=1172194 RepID=I8T9Z8_9GAMM|nr:hypothetical protein WQQ_08250 [Hydrocarboniphaga effusa AP103]